MYSNFERLLNEKSCRPADVARETGIHPSMFTDWKKGKSKPKVDKLMKIANYFGVPVTELLEKGE